VGGTAATAEPAIATARAKPREVRFKRRPATAATAEAAVAAVSPTRCGIPSAAAATTVVALGAVTARTGDSTARGSAAAATTAWA
jgi:hypothetical protein